MTLNKSEDSAPAIYFLLEACQRRKLDVKDSIVLEHRIDSGILFHIEGQEYDILSL